MTSALVSALVPALRYAQRLKSGSGRKRQWRDTPGNKAIENARKRELRAQRKRHV